MKNIALNILAITILIGVAVFATLAKQENIFRYHQHLQAEEKQPCSHNSKTLCTHLPIINIETETQMRFTPEYDPYIANTVLAKVSAFDDAVQNNHLNDAPSMESKARVRYRGNSSIYFDKKSIKVNLINEDFTENKGNEFLGMPKHDEWVLNGPFLDKTLIRNYLCMNTAGEILYDTPEVRFCEVVLNGEYQGVYLAMENVAKSSERVDISSYVAGRPFTSYILRSDRKYYMPYKLNNFSSYSRRIPSTLALEVVYPTAARTDETLMRYIEQDFSKFEKALYSFDYDDRLHGYQSNINTTSFVDYFIINEFFKNIDAGTYSTYFYKDLKGKINIGPVWDFNNACDNYMETQFDESDFSMVHKAWYFMLTKDESFIQAVIERYKSLRETSLNEAYLLNYIDETIAYLGPAVERNFEVWGYSFNPENLDEYNRLTPIERNPLSYQEAVEDLKAYIVKRGRWMDQNIDNLKQYSHESKTKKFNH